MTTTKRNAIIGIVGGALVVILIWYFVFYKPASDDLSKTQGELTTAERQQQTLEATLARLQDLDRNAPQQQANLQKLSAAIPSTPDLADFIFQANTAAADSGVDWVSIAPTPPAASTTGGPTVIVLAIQVNGGFFQVLDYLNRLEDLQRLVVTDTISVAAGGGEGSTRRVHDPDHPLDVDVELGRADPERHPRFEDVHDGDSHSRPRPAALAPRRADSTTPTTATTAPATSGTS